MTLATPTKDLDVAGRGHAAIGGNALRASVLGANDGLVSNLSLVMGVAGAQLDSDVILITGLAGLLAGACSMAMGEWISVQSSRELSMRELAVERAEIAQFPEQEEAELAGFYTEDGLSRPVAERLAAHVMEDEERALRVMAREELGIDPEGLGGSAWTAAVSSFVLFVVGAIVPVVWFTFLQTGTAIPASLVASALGLFVIGAAITRVTGRSPWRSGLRQLAIGLAAAGMTYAIGMLLGVSLGA
jgi:VIT1/CCC1 family predicted Fe2+/Mn2+ transporter